MIDEDLYQLAADELNSDRRRPHIWARACALASDDHDEARYLYTNLRVEELLAEQARGETGGSSSQSEPDNDSTLALAPIDETVNEDEDEFKGFLDDIRESDEDNPSPSSVAAPSGIDMPAASGDDILNLEPLTLDLDSTDLRDRIPASTRAGVDDSLEPDADLMADYVPENSDVLDDTFAGDAMAEEDFEKELENFKAENNVKTANTDADEAETDQLPELSDDNTFINANKDLDSTTDFSLDADEAQELVTLGEKAESEEPQLISSASMEQSDTVDADLTAVNPNDLTQANIGVLDAHTNELDEMLEDARYKPEEPEATDHSMEWLDDEPFSMDATRDREINAAREPEIYEADPYTDELSRQADELDLGHSEEQISDYSQQIADNLNQDPDFPEASQPTDAPSVDVAVPAAAAAVVASAPDLSSPGRAQSDTAQFPIDLTQGRKGKHFAVYKRNNHVQAVKTGVSWSALFLTLPYLIYRHLYGTALAYIVLWIVAIGGLILSGLQWIDAGAQVTPLVQACTIGFALLTFIGLIYLPFRHANSWRSDKLERRGFEMVATAKARNPGKAIARARRHAAFES